MAPSWPMQTLTWVGCIWPCAGELERLEIEAAAERARKERQKSFWESVTDGGAPAFTLGLTSPGVKSTEEPIKAKASQGGFRFNFGSSS
jgi:hypothetical protein